MVEPKLQPTENSFACWWDVMDTEALVRYRQDVLTNPGHDMAVLNHNSLRRLITLIDRSAVENAKWRSLLTAVLDTSGARGTYHSLRYSEAVERAEAALKEPRS